MVNDPANHATDMQKTHYLMKRVNSTFDKVKNTRREFTGFLAGVNQLATTLTIDVRCGRKWKLMKTRGRGL